MDTVREERYKEALFRIRETVTWHLRSHKCTTCGVTYQPGLHHGMRKCSIHPRASSGLSISADQVLATGGDLRATTNDYLCCGRSVPGRKQNDREHLPGPGNPGCTRADHVAHVGWQYLYPSSVRRHVNVWFHHAFAADESEARAAAWFHVFPSNILPLFGRELDEFVKSTGAVYVSKLEDIIHPWGSSKILIYLAGGYEFQIDLKEAYLFMLNKFNLPTEALQHTEARSHADALFEGVKEEFEGASDLLETLCIAIPGAFASNSPAPQGGGEDQLTSAMASTQRHAFGSSSRDAFSPVASRWSWPVAVWATP